MALLNEINVKGIPHPIVTDDGYYEEMTVGDAEQLIATQFVEDNEPYLFRPTGGSSDVGNRTYLDKIVGGTVAWNQLANRFRLYGSKGTVELSDNKYTYTFTALGANHYDNSIQSTNKFNSVSGHKYLELFDVFCTKAFTVSIGTMADNWTYSNVTANVKEQKGVIINGNGTTPFLYVGAGMNRANTFAVGDTFEISNIQLFDLTQMFGSTIADYIYSIEQSQAGAGVAWFKKLFPKDYYPYNAGELLSVEGLQSHDTVGFNQWDEEWELGIFNTTTGVNTASSSQIRSKNLIPILPNTTYYFKTANNYAWVIFLDADKNVIEGYYASTSNDGNSSTLSDKTFVTPPNGAYMKFYMLATYGTTYNHDICINLSDPSRNGEYEPYEKHSYPLDSSLTLRGIPKLDASNNIYYDGDEYASDGKVKRKYGIVDLGTLDWVYENNSFRTTGLYGIVKNYESLQVPNVLTTKYTPVSYKTDWADGMISFTYGSGTRKLVIYDSAYTDATTFKAAMSGVMLVYELATPTTEEAEPFQHIQIVDDFGTEEFVSTGIVPVGHNTRYPANLRDKLQHLPDLAGMDGTYLIRQSGKQMSLIHMPAVFPEIPTEDGTYVLKATVSGGTPTYVWEGVNAESEGE